MSETAQAAEQSKRANLNFLPGAPIDHTDVVNAKFRQGAFNYQFEKPYGNCAKRSRVMYCDSTGELEFILGQVARGNKVYILVGPKQSH